MMGGKGTTKGEKEEHDDKKHDVFRHFAAFDDLFSNDTKLHYELS